MKKLLAYLQILLLCNLVFAQGFWEQEDISTDDVVRALQEGEITGGELLHELEAGTLGVEVITELVGRDIARNTVSRFFEQQESITEYEDVFRDFVDLPKLHFEGQDVAFTDGALTTAGNTVRVDDFTQDDSIRASPGGWVINGDRIPGDVERFGDRVFRTELDGKSVFVDYSGLARDAAVSYRDGKLIVETGGVLIRPDSPIEVVGEGSDGAFNGYFVDLSSFTDVFALRPGLPGPLYVEGGDTSISEDSFSTTSGWYTRANIRGGVQEIALDCLAECDSTVSFTSTALVDVAYDPNLRGPVGIPELRTPLTTLAMGSSTLGYEVRSHAEPARVIFQDERIERLLEQGDVKGARAALSQGEGTVYLGEQAITNPNVRTRLGAYASEETGFNINGKTIPVDTMDDYVPVVEQKRPIPEDEILRLIEEGRLEDAEMQINELPLYDRGYYLGQLAQAHTIQDARYDDEGRLIIPDKAGELGQQAKQVFDESGTQVAMSPLMGGLALFGVAIVAEGIAPGQGSTEVAREPLRQDQVDGLFSDGEYQVYQDHEGNEYEVETEQTLMRIFHGDAILAQKNGEWYAIHHSDIEKFNTPDLPVRERVSERLLGKVRSAMSGEKVSRLRKKFIWRPTRVSEPEIDPNTGRVIGPVEVLEPARNIHE